MGETETLHFHDVGSFAPVGNLMYGFEFTRLSQTI